MKLDSRIKELIAVGASVTANCQACLEYHMNAAIQNGAGEEEIREAIRVGRIVRKGAASKLDQFASGLDHAAPAGESESSDECSLGMCEDDSEPDQAKQEGKLICSGIWGGIRNLDQEISAGAMAASLYSSSCDGGKGGDIYYFGVCKGDQITRVAIADVMGHGQAVSDVSQYVYEALSDHICDPESGTILSELNRLVSQRGVRAMTTAAVVAYSTTPREFQFSYAGHPFALHKRTDDEAWSVATPDESSRKDNGRAADIVLGIVPDATYGQHTIPAASGDRLFIYTDGATEARNAAGELFGTNRLKDVLDTKADAPLPQLKSAVLQALREYTDGDLGHDDVTLIAVEAR